MPTTVRKAAPRRYGAAAQAVQAIGIFDAALDAFLEAASWADDPDAAFKTVADLDAADRALKMATLLLWPSIQPGSQVPAVFRGRLYSPVTDANGKRRITRTQVWILD